MATSKYTTFGQRVRHARRECQLTQAALAKRVAHISRTQTSKSLVSHWENDRVANPQNATILAIVAVTGFSQEWLINGKGPERLKLPGLMVAEPAAVYGKGLDRVLLRRAILVACEEQKTPDGIANAAIEVFETLADEPDAPDGALRRIARLSRATS